MCLLVSAAAAHRRSSCGTKLGDIIIIIAPDCLHDTSLEVAIKHASSRRRWNDSERGGGGEWRQMSKYQTAVSRFVFFRDEEESPTCYYSQVLLAAAALLLLLFVLSRSLIYRNGRETRNP